MNAEKPQLHERASESPLVGKWFRAPDDLEWSDTGGRVRHEIRRDVDPPTGLFCVEIRQGSASCSGGSDEDGTDDVWWSTLTVYDLIVVPAERMKNWWFYDSDEAMFGTARSDDGSGKNGDELHFDSSVFVS